MKKIFTLLFAAIFVTACGNKTQSEKETVNYESEAKTLVEHGKELFDGLGNCFSCHKEDQKIIAPSLVEIATIYKTQNGDMVAFLKEKAKPIVDPSQYESMKLNFLITKEMSDDELKALEAYVMSFAK